MRNDERAKSLWNAHFAEHPEKQQLDFVVGKLSKAMDETHLKQLKDLVKFENNVDRGRIYGALLAMHLNAGQIDAGLELLKEAVDSLLPLEHISYHILNKFKTETLLNGKKFPFSIGNRSKDSDENQIIF